MKHAPFLLQAFAARILATKQSETVARADLEAQGYDVGTLVEMIAAYGALPEADRGFVVTATATEIHLRRKAVVSAPAQPPVTAAPPKVAAKPPPKKESTPGSPGLAALVRFGANSTKAGSKTRP